MLAKVPLNTLLSESLVHVIFGSGLPVAVHSRVTFSPSVFVRFPESSVMRDGTKQSRHTNGKNMFESCYEKAETFVTESPENKGIRVERYSHKINTPLSPKIIHHYHWNHKYSFVAKIHHYGLDALMHFMVTKSDMFSKGVMFYFIYSSFARHFRLNYIMFIANTKWCLWLSASLLSFTCHQKLN